MTLKSFSLIFILPLIHCGNMDFINLGLSLTLPPSVQFTNNTTIEILVFSALEVSCLLLIEKPNVTPEPQASARTNAELINDGGIANFSLSVPIDNYKKVVFVRIVDWQRQEILATACDDNVNVKPNFETEIDLCTSQNQCQL